MNTRVSFALTIALLLVVQATTSIVRAQPSPEQKKLDYFVGKWKADLDIKATATTAALKASGTEDCESFANLHVVCRSELTGGTGLYKAMRTFSYVPALKQYSSYTVDSLGYAVLTLGTVQGDTWTFTTEAGGYKTRTTMKTTKDGYTAAAEYAGPDGKWTPSSTSKFTRMK